MSKQVKYHINRNGIPAVCKAKEGNCPFGGTESHYDNFIEAQQEADKQNEEEFGLLFHTEPTFTEKENKAREEYTKSFFKKAESPAEKGFIRRKLAELRKESSSSKDRKYIDRCRRSELIPVTEDMLSARSTAHVVNERSKRTSRLLEEVGEGRVIAAFSINHLQEITGKGEIYVDQIVRLRDNGVISMLTADGKKEITTFQGSKPRLETYFLMAGLIPEYDFIETSAANRLKHKEGMRNSYKEKVEENPNKQRKKKHFNNKSIKGGRKRKRRWNNKNKQNNKKENVNNKKQNRRNNNEEPKNNHSNNGQNQSDNRGRKHNNRKSRNSKYINKKNNYNNHNNKGNNRRNKKKRPRRMSRSERMRRIKREILS